MSNSTTDVIGNGCWTHGGGGGGTIVNGVMYDEEQWWRIQVLEKLDRIASLLERMSHS